MFKILGLGVIEINKFYPSMIIFLMGFLFTYTPDLDFLNQNFNFGSMLKNLLVIVGVVMMVLGAFQALKLWNGVKKK